MIAEKGLGDLGFIGLEAALHLAPEALARGLVLGRHGAKVSAGDPAISPGRRNRPGVRSE